MTMELGKSGKRFGQLHPRDLRKADATPEHPTPAVKTQKKARKRFGYQYQYRGRWGDNRKWRTREHYHWYETERQRDDAMKAAAGAFRGVYEIRNVTAITR